MATYKGIQGYSVQTLASDPSPTASVEGQLWYNSTSGTYKIAIAGAGAWASGNVVNTGVKDPGCLGIQTAAMKFGGKTTVPTANSETYDGTSWSEGANIGSARYGNAGFGTTTAGVNACGAPPTGGLTTADTWNGSSWTSTNSTNTGRYKVHGIGVQTAGIIVGGEVGELTVCETFDGTSWAETGDLNTGRGNTGLAGTSTATLASGGGPGNGLGVVESFNGTSWTETTDLNSDRANPNGGGAVFTAALVFGGTTPPGQTVTGITEKWNGSAWTEVGDLASGRQQLGAGQTGPSSASLAFCGPPAPTATEEWTDPVYAVKTVTTS